MIRRLHGRFRLTAINNIELMVSMDMSIFQAVSNIDQVDLFQRISLSKS